MQQAGFHHTPITRTLLFTLILTSLLSTLTSTKPYFHLQIHPHILGQHQFSRIPLFQLLYANSGELLFASLLLYHLRLLERLFGSRKYLSLLLYTYAATSLAVPAVLFLGWGVTYGRWNYVPPGPTPLLFALLSQYHAAVPGTYKFGVVLPGGAGELNGSDKVYAYILALQLAVCQLPGSAAAAGVGWVVGYAWRLDLLPKTRWRVGRWAVRMLGGEDEGREFEGLRRRLRGEMPEEEGAGPIIWRVLGQFRGR